MSPIFVGTVAYKTMRRGKRSTGDAPTMARAVDPDVASYDGFQPIDCGQDDGACLSRFIFVVRWVTALTACLSVRHYFFGSLLRQAPFSDGPSLPEGKFNRSFS